MSQQRTLTLEKKIFPPLMLGLEPVIFFDRKSGILPTELSQLSSELADHWEWLDRCSRGEGHSHLGMDFLTDRSTSS